MPINPWAAYVRLRSLLGRPFRLRTDDRRVLDQVIIPELAGRAGIERVLFVGCAIYTQHYEGLFGGAEFHSIEPDPRQARWGARRHVVDVLQNGAAHWAPGYFDLIVCNGVYGWGLDARDDIERAMNACFTLLRERGLLILGWNDTPERTPVPLTDISALARFEPHAFAPLGASRHLCAGAHRHVFSFFEKPGPRAR